MKSFIDCQTKTPLIKEKNLNSNNFLHFSREMKGIENIIPIYFNDSNLGEKINTDSSNYQVKIIKTAIFVLSEFSHLIHYHSIPFELKNYMDPKINENYKKMFFSKKDSKNQSFFYFIFFFNIFYF